MTTSTTPAAPPMTDREHEPNPDTCDHRCGGGAHVVEVVVTWESTPRAPEPGQLAFEVRDGTSREEG